MNRNRDSTPDDDEVLVCAATHLDASTNIVYKEGARMRRSEIPAAFRGAWLPDGSTDMQVLAVKDLVGLPRGR